MNQLRLKELLSFDHETGSFFWACRRKGIKLGQKAGWNNDLGYTVVGLDGKNYYGHRLAWMYVHGAWPASELDHINGNKGDNRLANLRLSDRSKNMHNLKSARADSQTGMLGVSYHQAAKQYEASIQINGKKKYLGLYKTIAAAAAAYAKAKRAWAIQNGVQIRHEEAPIA